MTAVATARALQTQAKQPASAIIWSKLRELNGPDNNGGEQTSPGPQTAIDKHLQNYSLSLALSLPLSLSWLQKELHMHGEQINMHSTRSQCAHYIDRPQTL